MAKGEGVSLPVHPQEILTRMLKHGPLPPVAIPGFHPAFPKGMGAVVPFFILKMSKVSALGTPDCNAKLPSLILTISLAHRTGSSPLLLAI
jgi:hypothetical protein